MQIYFSDRAYRAILAETLEKIKTETGGVFLGAYENDNWYIVEAIDPGPKSVFHVAYFEYDQKYITHLINKMAKLYSAKLTLVGLWHRHPGSFDQFSSTDNGTNRQYAELSPNGAVSVLVNIDPVFRMTAYHVGLPLKYTRIQYTVGDEYIPDKYRLYKTEETMLASINKDTQPGSDARPKDVSNLNFGTLIESILLSFEPVNYTATDEGSEKIEAEKVKDMLIDALFDDLTFLSEQKGMTLAVEQNDQYLSIYQPGNSAKLHFAYLPDRDSIVFSYNDSCYLYKSGLFSRLLREPMNREGKFKLRWLNSFGINML